MAGSVTTLDELTPKQRQVMKLACDHYTYKEIGRRLDLSPRTVEGHMDSVRSKLGVSSRQDALRMFADMMRSNEAKPRIRDVSDGVKTPGGFDRVEPEASFQAQHWTSEGDLVFRDAIPFDGAVEWQESRFRIPDIRPADIGPVGRLTAILVLAVLTASVLLVGLTIAATLGEIV